MRPLALTTLFALGCTHDPIYLPAPMQLEAGMADMMGELSEARVSVQIPVVAETMEDMEERLALQAQVDMVTGGGIDVPYVRLGDLEVSVEWAIKNLTDREGKAKIQLNGANQFFAYDPTLVVISEDDEAPPSPPLAGDIPLVIPPNGELRGVFREDELREASVDLDAITRAAINPFRATLVVDKHATELQQLSPLMYDMDGEPLPQMPTGVTIPRDAFAQLLRVDIVFQPDRHMVLEYTVRVRDVRGDLIHDLAMDAFVDPEAMAELQPFAPADFATAPPAPGAP